MGAFTGINRVRSTDMDESEYRAGEITDAQLDAQADAGLYYLDEDGFFEWLTDAEIDRVAYQGERHLRDGGIIPMLDEWDNCDAEL